MKQEHVGGLVRGTLISTSDGLRPIESLKVGDLVVSSPEDDPAVSRLEPVVGLFRHDGQKIRQLLVDGGAVGKIEMIAASWNTPFWAVNEGWTRADALNRQMALRRLDGTDCDVVRQYPVYRTEAPGVGWTQSMAQVELSHGNLYDYDNAKGLPMGGFDCVVSQEVLNSEQPFLTTTVWDLRLGGLHNFYAGKQTVRVRCLDGAAG